MPNRLIHRGRLIALHEEQVTLRSGGETSFDIVKHPGGAVIAAINQRNEICLLAQWRHAVQETIWELPAGCLEPGEPPLETAKRELEEEAGVTAREWEAIGQIVTSPGFSNERLYFFVAHSLQQGVAKLDDAEQLEPHWMALDQVYTMVTQGKIIDAKTLSLLLHLQLNGLVG